VGVPLARLAADMLRRLTPTRPPPPRHLHRPGSHQLSHASTLLLVGRPRLLAMGLAPPLLNRATRARCGRPPSHGLDPGP
jgi:hypothetical protein